MPTRYSTLVPGEIPDSGGFVPGGKETFLNLLGSGTENLLSFLPGSGQAMAARDSSRQFDSAISSFKKGEYAKASANTIDSFVSGMGAVPVLSGVIASPATKKLRKMFETLTRGDDIEAAKTKIAGWELRKMWASTKNKPFNETFPYSNTQLKVLKDYENLSKSSPYVFHTTKKDNLNSIAEKGLLPNLPKRQEGISGDKVYLSANEALANTFGSSEDVILRVRKNYVFKDLEEDILAGGGAYQTPSSIPPEALEIKVGKKWLPLLPNKLKD